MLRERRATDKNHVQLTQECWFLVPTTTIKQEDAFAGLILPDSPGTLEGVKHLQDQTMRRACGPGEMTRALVASELM